jgi:hypothetical protein
MNGGGPLEPREAGRAGRERRERRERQQRVCRGELRAARRHAPPAGSVRGARLWARGAFGRGVSLGAGRLEAQGRGCRRGFVRRAWRVRRGTGGGRGWEHTARLRGERGSSLRRGWLRARPRARRAHRARLGGAQRGARRRRRRRVQRRSGGGAALARAPSCCGLRRAASALARGSWAGTARAGRAGRWARERLVTDGGCERGTAWQRPRVLPAQEALLDAWRALCARPSLHCPTPPLPRVARRRRRRPRKTAAALEPPVRSTGGELAPNCAMWPEIRI